MVVIVVVVVVVVVAVAVDVAVAVAVGVAVAVVVVVVFVVAVVDFSQMLQKWSVCQARQGTSKTLQAGSDVDACKPLEAGPEGGANR